MHWLSVLHKRFVAFCMECNVPRCLDVWHFVQLEFDVAINFVLLSWPLADSFFHCEIFRSLANAAGASSRNVSAKLLSAY